ncbi:hypothetical protein WDU94_007690 [Cyamophila willieti]
MSAPDKKHSSVVEEIKKTKLLCFTMEAELKKKKLDLKRLASFSDEMSRKLNTMICENQVLNADIVLSKVQIEKIHSEIDSINIETEKIMIDSLNMESKRKQCELNNKLIEQSMTSLRGSK